jgi:hypothetical protein
MEQMRAEHLGYTETVHLFGINGPERIRLGEHIYLEEGPEGLRKEWLAKDQRVERVNRRSWTKS